MRGRKKEIEGGIRANIIFPEKTFVKAEARGIKPGQFSSFVREVVDQALDSPLDITESEIRKQLQSLDIQRADLTRRLEEIGIEREREQDARITREREGPVISLIINRIKRMITKEFLADHLASVIFELGLVQSAKEVGNLKTEWVKPVLPFARKVILEDVRVELDKAASDWPRTYSQDEAIKYALVDVCGYPESVLMPMSKEEKIKMVRNSVLRMFPDISDGDDKKRALAHVTHLLKAYSLDDPPKQLLETFYREGKEAA